MKKLHIIHAKTINDVSSRVRGRVLPTLEKEVLSWAKDSKKEAYKATLEVQAELKKNPTDTVKAKYFKYLKRLLELKLQKVEDDAHKADKPNPKINQKLAEWLNFESVRIQEHISCSSIGLYEFCPRKYYYRYLLGVKFPQTTALFYGNCIDNSLNFYYEEKIKGNTPPKSALHAQFFEEFAKGTDVNWGDDDPEQLRKSGPTVLDAYVKAFDNLTNATDVQTEVIIPLENGGHFLGYIDILEADAVVDTKTAKTFWNDKGRYAKHLQEAQPKAYSLWFLEKFEKMPKEFRYQIVTKETDEKGNPTPQTQLIKFQVKQFELESFRRRIQKIWDEIKERTPKGKVAFPAQAEFGPAEGRGPGKRDVGYLCTQEWCEYHKLCKQDGLKIPLKWISKTATEPGYHLYE